MSTNHNNNQNFTSNNNTSCYGMNNNVNVDNTYSNFKSNQNTSNMVNQPTSSNNLNFNNNLYSNGQNTANSPHIFSNAQQMPSNNNFNKVSILKNSNICTLHPWLVHLSTVGHTAEIKSLENLNDFLIMRCISKHLWTSAVNNDEREKYRCSLISYLFSKLSAINLMTGRSLFKDMITILDEQISMGININTYGHDFSRK